MLAEEMTAGHETTVGGSVEVGFTPVPCGVEADCPPEGAGVPDAEAKNESNGASGKETDRRLSGIATVTESKEEGKDKCAPPESDTASHGVLHVAAQEGLFAQANQQEHDRPGRGLSQDGCAMEHLTIKGEEAGFPKHEHKSGDTDETPDES